MDGGAGVGMTKSKC
uniref:Uncharacterized protein n=1 Tax=Arundo donax TaxID=35708 RepID=A0A0A8YBG6_ARUDO